MSRRLFVITTAAALMLILISLIAGCEKTELAKNTGQPSTSATQPSTQVQGEKFENADFSITVPKDWVKTETRGGLQITEQVALDSIVIKFAGSNYKPDWAKKRMDDSVKAYNASTPEEVNAFGKTWWKTTFTFMEYQSLYVRVTPDGFLVEVSLNGKNHDSNKTMKAVLDTLVFKR
jgi:hypothetical protein